MPTTRRTSSRSCADPQWRDPARALELAKRAVQAEPSNGVHFRVLAAAHYRAGNWQDALDAARQAHKLAPGRGSSPALLFAAMAHWQLGDSAAARTCYARAARRIGETEADDAGLRRLQEERRSCSGSTTRAEAAPPRRPAHGAAHRVTFGRA